VFDHLQQAGLKCFLFQREVKLLEHIVSKDGVALEPAKVQAVQDWPATTGVTEMKRFLGLCSYYHRFIREFADIAHPLHQCAEKTHPFVWTSEANEAFVDLKRALTEAPLLSYPNPDECFRTGHRYQQSCSWCCSLTVARGEGVSSGLLQPSVESSRASILHHQERVACSCQSCQTFPSLPLWQIVRSLNRPCSPTLAAIISSS